MAESEDRAAKPADPGRAVAFSDGVFAIIITLLVLDLRPPEPESGRLLSGLLGVVVAPLIALAVFFILPVFYGITSEGLYELPAIVRRP